MTFAIPHDAGPVFVGSNPGVVLYDDAGTPVVRISVWDAQWSIRGRGRVAILALHERPALVVSPRAELAEWLAVGLTAYFPEFAGVALDKAVYHDGEVAIPELTPTTFGAAFETGEGVCHVYLEDSLDLRPDGVDVWPMGDHRLRLTNLLAPCSAATIVLNEDLVPGTPRVDTDATPPRSSAFIATNERWDVVSGLST